jgi:hypothetical protein
VRFSHPAAVWPWRTRLRFGWYVTPLAIYLAVRLGIGLVNAASLLLVPLRPGLGPRSFADSLWLDGWLRWDALPYLALAQEGYWYDPQTGLGSPLLPPLFPAVLHLLLPVFGYAEIAGAVLASLVWALALVVVYRLFAEELGYEVAATGCWLLGVYPYSFTLASPYPHALGLLLAALTFLSLRRGNLWLAGASALLASLSVPAGLALWPAVVVGAWRHDRQRLGGAAVLLAAAAIWLGWCLYLSQEIGLPLEAVLRQVLGIAPQAPLLGGLATLVAGIRQPGSTGVLFGFNLALALVVLALSPIVWRRLGRAYGLYVVAVAAFGLLCQTPTAGLTVLLAFPAFASLASHLKHEATSSAVLAVSAFLLSAFTAAFATGYPVVGSPEAAYSAYDQVRLVSRYEHRGDVPARRLTWNVATDLLILGYDLGAERVAPGRTLELIASVYRLHPTERRYLLSAHLVDAGGKRWGTGYSEIFATKAPTPLEQGLTSKHDLSLVVDPQTPAGLYRLELVPLIVPLYSTVYETPQVLDDTGALVQDQKVAEIVVAGEADMQPTAEVRPSQPLRVQFGDDLQLMGFDCEPPAPLPDSAVKVSLYWTAVSPPARDYTVFVQLLDASGKPVAQDDSWPLSGRFPTSRLRPGLAVRDVHTLSVPPTARGPFRLIAGLYRLETMQRLPVANPDGRAPADHVLLAEFGGVR